MLCKMNISRVLPVIAWGLILAACETVNPATVPSPELSELSELSKPSTELSARNLNPGECGLFVWAGEARNFILFSQSGKEAQYANGAQEIALTPLTTEAEALSGDLYGQIPAQSFLDETGRRYDLRLSHASEIQDGIRYAGGSWRHKNDEGWDVVTPVYGLSTCQSVS